MLLTPVSPSLLFSKDDPEDVRIGDLVLQKSNAPVILWSLPDDEGIDLNGGRPGARLAPNEIRRALYKMTPPARGPFISGIHDLGDLDTRNLSLNDKHRNAQSLAQEQWQLAAQAKTPKFLISLGGGHDYGYADASAFLKNHSGKNPLILNFDAHLDVRPTQSGNHSGTPFRRLLEEFQNFEFWELGIQPQCNSKFHLDWAEKKNARVLFLEQMRETDPSELFLETNLERPCWISLDIDVFASSLAPGASASAPTGLEYLTFLKWLRFLIQNFDVKGISIYEVSPSLDVDHRTSKLAALILFEALLEIAKKWNP